MRPIFYRATGKAALVTILAMALCYPQLAGSKEDWPKTVRDPATLTISRIASVSGKPFSQKQNTSKLKTPRNIRRKQMAMMYFLWYALKHNRPG